MHEFVKPGVRFEQCHKMASGCWTCALSFTQTPFLRGIPSTGSVNLVGVADAESWILRRRDGFERRAAGRSQCIDETGYSWERAGADNQRLSSTDFQLRVSCDD